LLPHHSSQGTRISTRTSFALYAPRLTQLLAGDEFLRIPVDDDPGSEDDKGFRRSDQELLKALLAGENYTANVTVADLGKLPINPFRNTLAGHYDLLRRVSGPISSERVMQACLRNGKVAMTNSEFEIAALWRLARLAFRWDPSTSIHSAILLTNIIEELDSR